MCCSHITACTDLINASSLSDHSTISKRWTCTFRLAQSWSLRGVTCSSKCFNMHFIHALLSEPWAEWDMPAGGETCLLSLTHTHTLASTRRDSHTKWSTVGINTGDQNDSQSLNNSTCHRCESSIYLKMGLMNWRMWSQSLSLKEMNRLKCLSVMQTFI